MNRQIPREQIEVYGAGNCIAFREQNMYHDSYFHGLFAVKDDTQPYGYRFEWKETGATAYAGGFCAVPDASHAVLAAYRATREEKVAQIEAEQAENEKRKIEKGKTVIAVKGRKVPKGTIGVVMWQGKDAYRPERTWGSGYGAVTITHNRIGLKIEGNDKLVYSAEENFRVLGYENEDEYADMGMVHGLLLQSWPNA